MIITALITTRNRAALLREAMESALRQEPCGHEVEILVVDDDSTDDTPQVVAACPAVRYVRTKRGTCAGSRNAGIEQASGQWIALLDDDDVWLPHKLRRCCEALAANPEARLLFSAARLCDFRLQPDDSPHGYWRGPDLAKHSSAYEAFLDDLPSPSTIMLHRDVFDRIGVFDPSAPRAEDRDMWFRVTSHDFACIAVPEALALYRLRERPDGELLYQGYQDSMTVLRRYFAPGMPMAPGWKRRQQVFRHLRGWYAHQILTAARQAQADNDPRHAARFRRLALAISPVHGIKEMLTSRGGDRG